MVVAMVALQTAPMVPNYGLVVAVVEQAVIVALVVVALAQHMELLVLEMQQVQPLAAAAVVGAVLPLILQNGLQPAVAVLVYMV